MIMLPSNCSSNGLPVEQSARDPYNLNRQVSSLVEHLTPDQGDVSSNLQRDKSCQASLKGQCHEIFCFCFFS
jgi:hypothetical protein